MEKLLSVRFSAGEYQGCHELYTADCTKGAIVMERNCPEAVQVADLCLSGETCEEPVLTKTVEKGQTYNVFVRGQDDTMVETGTVEIKVIDPADADDPLVFAADAADDPDDPVFISAAPVAAVIWDVFVVAVSLVLMML